MSDSNDPPADSGRRRSLASWLALLAVVATSAWLSRPGDEPAPAVPTRPEPAASADLDAQPPTGDAQALEAYRRGLAVPGWNDPTADGRSAAAAWFERAVELDPSFALAHAALAEALAPRDRPDAARCAAAGAAAERALALDPEPAAVHRAAGLHLLACGGDRGVALRTLARAEARRPGDARALWGMARIRQRQGRFGDALLKLRRAQSHAPDQAWLAAELARVLDFLRRHRDAERFWRLAIRRDPAEVRWHLGLACHLLHARGDVAGARAVLEDLPAPGSDDAARTLVRYRLELWAGDPDAALEVLATASAETFDTGLGPLPAAYLRAVALDRRGDAGAAGREAETARRALDRRLAASPDDARAHAALGHLLAQLGDTAGALGHARRAVELSPVADDAVAHGRRLEDLAAVHARLGQRGEALEVLRRLLAMPSRVSAEGLRVDPRWAVLWDEPDFFALLMLQGAPE